MPIIAGGNDPHSIVNPNENLNCIGLHLALSDYER